MQDFISVLPKDISVYIFTLIVRPRILQRLRLVSKTWKDFLQKNLSIIPVAGNPLLHLQFLKLFSNLTEIQNLEISADGSASPLLSSLCHWPRIQKVAFSQQSSKYYTLETESSILQLITQATSNLQYLNSLQYFYVDILPKRFVDLAKLPNLSSLIIGVRVSLNFSQILPFKNQLTNLQILGNCEPTNQYLLSQFGRLRQFSWSNKSTLLIPSLPRLISLELESSGIFVSIDTNFSISFPYLQSLRCRLTPSNSCIESISSLTTLTDLSIRLGTNGALFCSLPFPNIMSLKLQATILLTPTLYGPNWPSLYELTYSCALTDVSLESLKTLTQLTRFNVHTLSFCSLNDLVASLTSLVNLQTLSLMFSYNNGDLSPLSALPLSSISLYSITGVVGIEALTNLTSLSLPEYELTSKGETKVTTLTKLEMLKLYVEEATIFPFWSTQNLRAVHLSFYDSDSDPFPWIKCLSGLTKLETIQFSFRKQACMSKQCMRKWTTAFPIAEFVFPDDFEVQG
jgi:hypothetical protein